MSTTTSLIIAILAGILGIVIGFFFRKSLAEKKIRSAEDYAVKIIEDANKDAETKKKELLVEAKDEIFKMKSDLDRENKSRLKEISRQEDRLNSKEENLERKNASLEKKHKKLDSELKKADDMQLKIQSLIDEKELELEKVAGLTSDEAKNIVLERVKTETIREQAAIIKEIESKTKEESEKFAREIISTSIQRYAADQVAESTVSVVNLPNDDMKGRIIGREGRNIRAFETLTGVDLIIDDTPEAVVLSAFDPVRREIA
ncbi:MAG: Rnase Y domain-containing protein, partial [Finegoldia magna]|nr:Rnase Y domain-containing protein [Finegoldia magna]